MSVLEASRVLKVARATVQARLDKMQRDGVISGWGPRIAPALFGYPVVAFCFLVVNQEGKSAPDRFAAYRRLRFDEHSYGVVLITLSNPGKLNATDATMHAELARVFHDLSFDEAVQAADTVLFALPSQLGSTKSCLLPCRARKMRRVVTGRGVAPAARSGERGGRGPGRSVRAKLRGRGPAESDGAL